MFVSLSSVRLKELNSVLPVPVHSNLLASQFSEAGSEKANVFTATLFALPVAAESLRSCSALAGTPADLRRVTKPGRVSV